MREESGKLAGLSLVFLGVMTLGYAAYATDRTVLSSVLAPLSASLTLSNSEIGLLSAAQYIGVACVVFLAGHLSDRYGRWTVIISGVAVFSGFTWLIGFATNFTEAFAFRFLSGLGEGAFWPVAMAAVATHFKERKGLALGIFYVGFDAGSVFGLTMGGIAYSLYGGWSQSFFIAPLIGLPVIAGTLFARTRLGATGQGSEGIKLGRDALALSKQRNVLLVVLFALLATWAAVWQVAFLPFYFFKVIHTTVLTAALLSSVVTVAGGCGKVLLGGASDRWRRDRLLVLASLATLASYVLFFTASQLYVDLVGAISMGFFSSSIFPIMQSLMTDTCDGKAGTAMGLTTTAQSVATIFSPIITASLFIFGVGRGVALGATIPATLAVFVALLLREPRRRMLRPNSSTTKESL